jgi:hypothetical protein
VRVNTERTCRVEAVGGVTEFDVTPDSLVEW